jgi:hypothetical protein
LALSKKGDVAVCEPPPPPPPPSGTITYTNTNGLDTSVIVTSVEPEGEEIILSPRFEEQSEISYTAALQLENVRVLSIEPVDTNPITDPPLLDDMNPTINYLPLRLPRMSRVVDFSNNVEEKPKYNANLLDVDLNLLSYDPDIGYWKTSATTEGDCSRSDFEHLNIPGDFYFIVDRQGHVVPQLRLAGLLAPSGRTTFDICDVFGLYRGFQNFGNIKDGRQAGFDIVNAHADGNVTYIMGGFTLPLNHVLLNNGYQGVKDNGTLTKTPDAAVETLSPEACKKLKTALGNSGRIYLIKYKTDAPTGLDSDDCTNYRYTVNSAEALNAKLKEIAKDIKSFAGYRDAVIKDSHQYQGSTPQ